MVIEISPRTAFDPDTARRPTTEMLPTHPVPGGGDPDAAPPLGEPPTQHSPAGRLVVLLRGFYRDRLAWVALAVTTLTLCYLGGAAMFWVPAMYLGETGPEIRPILHYALDSTAGVLGLTPALFFIVPFAVWAGRDQRLGRGRERPAGGGTGNTAGAGPAAGAGTRAAGTRPVRYALAGGTVFGLITVGGPFAHDTLVARGTWIAHQVTDLVGTAGAPTGTGVDIPLPESMLAQLLAGLPVYVLLMWASLHAVRGLTRTWHTLRHGSAEVPA